MASQPTSWQKLSERPTASNVNDADLTLVVQAGVSKQATVGLLRSNVDAVKLGGQLPSAYTRSAATTPPSALTPGASPWVYINPDPNPVALIVQGGTVTLLEFSRDGTTWYNLGTVAGMVYLAPSDRIRITHSAAPTVTKVPL